MARRLLGVPFVGKDCPSDASQFAHPDVVIGLTVLAYRYEGLRRTDFTSLLSHLKREMAAQVMCMACSSMHPMHVCTCASG